MIKTKQIDQNSYPMHPYFSCMHVDNLHFSIFTATVIKESALERPYAVASTTFPNAPDPNVFPEDKKTGT